ncbi:hypothetical protein [Dyella kyungheensis]|jgi:hypothetical protein|uniref:Secreted protein n=1 Tax=Dyella kyungheensis TaxID=1242174 RepID=A0ABS2JV77_9GAMM|nr:hypothetical protein [Dyella kyungheensis]MBM7122925.1 hypothetical protein [Dyella kyungheensis]
MRAQTKIAVLAGLIAAACIPAVVSAQTASNHLGALEEQAQASWRESMAHIATPSEGCFEATYPSVIWHQAACHEVTPRVAPVPRFRLFNNGAAQTAGNGNDYTIQTTSLITQAVGSFPSVTGVTSESGVGVAAYGGGGILGANEYSLQINSSFDDTTSACKSHSGCTVWQQFVYAPDYEVQGQAAVFMQYWLIGYGGTTCPSGFGSDGEGDCYKNSAAATAPDVPATQLANVKLTGSVTAGGNDTVVFTNGTKAYTSSGKDSVLLLAQVWKVGEFNVVGNAGGSEAKFNSGSSITVKLAVTDGSTAVPSCVANSGSTGESNNLNLGSCTKAGGSTPYIQFTESN